MLIASLLVLVLRLLLPRRASAGAPQPVQASLQQPPTLDDVMAGAPLVGEWRRAARADEC